MNQLSVKEEMQYKEKCMEVFAAKSSRTEETHRRSYKES